MAELPPVEWLERERIRIEPMDPRPGLLPEDPFATRMEIEGPCSDGWMRWRVLHGGRLVASGEVWSGHRSGPWETCFAQANRLMEQYVMGPWPPAEK